MVNPLFEFRYSARRRLGSIFRPRKKTRNLVENLRKVDDVLPEESLDTITSLHGHGGGKVEGLAHDFAEHLHGNTTSVARQDAMVGERIY